MNENGHRGRQPKQLDPQERVGQLRRLRGEMEHWRKQLEAHIRKTGADWYRIENGPEGYPLPHAHNELLWRAGRFERWSQAHANKRRQIVREAPGLIEELEALCDWTHNPKLFEQVTLEVGDDG